MLLAGDIGGTKTNLAIYSPEKGAKQPLAESTFASAKYPDLETLVGEFLSQLDFKVERASFGVAGPVVGGRAVITNLDWVIDEASLAKRYNFSSVSLVNDLVAVALAVPLLDSNDLHTLNTGVTETAGAKAVIAPGTGLGEAFLTWDGNRYQAHASEGGHADFAPTSKREVKLLQYLQERHDHVSYELVCSGRGLPNIYNYLKDGGFAPELDWLAQALAGAHDPTPVIVAGALDSSKPCLICAATLTTFVSVLGAEAGNLALKVLATGGVYLGGGIPPRILPVLKREFMTPFARKGRMRDLLARVPVHVIMNPKAALLGAASLGLDRPDSG